MRRNEDFLGRIHRRFRLNVEIEWIAGVIRAYEDGKGSANKDPYSFAATIRAAGDTVEILGCANTPPIDGFKELMRVLRRQGFRKIIWSRFKDGKEKQVAVPLRDLDNDPTHTESWFQTTR